MMILLEMRPLMVNVEKEGFSSLAIRTPLEENM
jgi:hypothetical protein